MELPGWIHWLDSRFGHWSVPHLIRNLVWLNCLTFLLSLYNPSFTEMLQLNPDAIRQGEVWRMLTFLCVPGFGTGYMSILFFILAMRFVWLIGDGLEEAWGALAVNGYLLLSVAVLTLTGLLLYSVSLPNIFIFSSLLFAFASLYPEFPITLFPFPITVPIRYVAYFSGAYLALLIFISPVMAPVILASLSGYFIYLGPATFQACRFRYQNYQRRKKFERDRL